MTDKNDFWKELFGEDMPEEQKPAAPDKADDTKWFDEKDRASKPEEDLSAKTSQFIDYVPKNAAAKQGKGRKKGKSSSQMDTGPDDFDVDFDFDGEYKDIREKRAVRLRKDKRTGCIGGLLYAAFIISISLLLAALAWMAAVDVLGLGKENSEREVTIPDTVMTGEIADVEEIADILHDQGLVKYKFLFKLFANFSTAEEKIKPGTYKINTNFDYRALVQGLTPGIGEMVEVDITIPEGYTLYKIFNLLAESGVCELDELWDAAANYDFDYDFLDSSTLGETKRLEGYLFPDTYKFYLNDTPSRVINKMLANFDNKFKDEYVERAEELGYSVRDIVIIASMIEREAAYDAERDLIASVIYNRLESSNFTNLQIDATIYYAIEGTDDEFTITYDSPYNTYICEDLPIGPISSPGMASIRAALYPQESDYYYYALSTEGGHRFFTYKDDFDEFVASSEYGG